MQHAALHSRAERTIAASILGTPSLLLLLVCGRSSCWHMPVGFRVCFFHLVGKPSRMPSASTRCAVVTRGTSGFGGPCILATTSSGSVSGICTAQVA